MGITGCNTYIGILDRKPLVDIEFGLLRRSLFGLCVECLSDRTDKFTNIFVNKIFQTFTIRVPLENSMRICTGNEITAKIPLGLIEITHTFSSVNEPFKLINTKSLLLFTELGDNLSLSASLSGHFFVLSDRVLIYSYLIFNCRIYFFQRSALLPGYLSAVLQTV